jgi:PAS domain S-box-containing protein
MNSSNSTRWNERCNANGRLLGDNDRMFQFLFEHNADAIWLIDPETATVVDCNESTVALMRCRSRADLVGKQLEELLPLEQRGASASAAAQSITEKLKNGNSKFDWTSRRFDGTEVLLEAKAETIERDGQRVIVLVSRRASERKATEGELPESEARFRSFFERNADAMSLFDPKTLRYIEVNEAVVRLIGAPSREALRNVSPVDRWPERQPDGRLSIEKVREMVKLALTQGSHRFEWLTRRYDGRELPLDVVMTAVPVGERTLLSIVYRDISMHKQAESEIRRLNAELEKRVSDRTADLVRSNEQLKQAEAELRTSEARLRESEARFSTAFRASPALMTISRLSDEKYIEVNDAFLRWHGLRRDDILGHDTKELGTWLSLEDRAKFWEDLRRDGSVREVECQAWSHRGTVGTLLLSADIIEINREPHVIATGLDITERKQTEAELRESEARLRESEARFSAAFRASPALISLMRLNDGKFVEVNDAFARWLGLSRDSIVGYDTMQLNVWLNRNDRAKFLLDLRRDGSVREFECQFRNWRGTLHTIVLSAEIIEINREPHILGFGIDVTERKLAETELLRTLAREKELGRLRSHFVSMLSHEFRTPLGIIQSSAEILEDYLERLEPAERKDHLQSIRKNTRRMAELMEEALLLGSLDGGKMEFKPAPVKVRTFVQNLVEEVVAATNRRCPIELSLAEMPEEIQADERLLQHIFTNLLTNAVKYSDEGRW